MAIIEGTADNDFLVGTEADDTLLGLDGDDTLMGNAGDDALSGGNGMDILIGGTGNDTLDGGAGDDAVQYADVISTDGITGVTVDLNSTGAQDIGGDAGIDTLISIEQIVGSFYNDTLTGNAADNLLMGLDGDDVITGGQGNDLLVGGAGVDTFNYSFAHSGAVTINETFAGWLESQGLSTSGWTKDFFTTQYTGFLQHLVDTYDLGSDVDADGKIKINIKAQADNGLPKIEGLTADEVASYFGDQQATLVTGPSGKKLVEVSYYNDFSITGEATLASTDGHDTIQDFTWGEDVLNFKGLAGMTKADFVAQFTVTEGDTDGDGVLDTVIAQNDGSWSVALIGVSGHTADDVYDTSHFS